MPDSSQGGAKVVQAADEEDWLDLLIASERISEWLDLLRVGTVEQQRQAAERLLAEVQAKEAYTEEAKAAGAVGLLTGILKRSDDEKLVASAAAIISICSGPLAGGKKVQDVSYGQHVIHIQEGALGDGLGSRVWVAAHCLCRRLIEKPDIVRRQDVLEIGSGCGLCGILAAKLGAQRVTMTDYEQPVLLNLRDSVAANTREGCASNSQITEQRFSHRMQSHQDEVGASADAMQSMQIDDKDNQRADPLEQISAWDKGNMRVRLLDWTEALSEASRAAVMKEDLLAGRPADSKGPPALPKGKKFPVIIGSDLMYELYHSDLVAALLKQRLTAQGKAYIALAVRRQAHLDRLLQEARRQGLEVASEQIDLDPQAVGIMGRENEYEGGFVLLTISLVQM